MMKNSKPDPTPKELVVVLTQLLREETKTFCPKSGKLSTKTYLVHKCPGQFCTDNNSEIRFEKGTGYNNPFRHLKSCLANGNVSELHSMYYANLKAKQEAKSEAFKLFAPQKQPRFEALYDYIRVVILNCLPLGIVEDARFRSFSKHEEAFSEKTVRKVLTKLKELVEKKIAEELQAARRGSILHGCWPRGVVHYLGLFASYIKESHDIVNGTAQHSARKEMALLSCSPIATYDSEITEQPLEDEGITFSAEIRAQHIMSVFRFYGIAFSSWAVCQTAENCKINRKVALLLGIPHVACKSHLLNLEVNQMTGNSADLKRTLDMVHDTMVYCKQSLGNTAILRTIVAFQPILHNPTRWSGKCFMLQWFLHVRDKLLEEPSLDSVVNSSPLFKTKVERYCKHLFEIDYATKHLETSKLSLGECQEVLNMLIDEIDAGFDDPTSPFHRCYLKSKYIAVDACILVNSCFETGVCKIQRGELALLTEQEKEACAHLVVEHRFVPVENDSDEFSPGSYIHRFEKRKRTWAISNDYKNCDFILGSVAEVERLRSTADTILNCNPMEMDALVFESFVFLKVNERFWDMQMVQQAYDAVR